MVRSSRPKAVVAPLAALAALLALACQTTAAQEKPFKITGAGVGPTGLPLPGQEPRSHWIVGVATHLGLHYGEGTVRTDTAVFDPTIGTMGGFTGQFGSGSPFVFTGANGDQLACYYGRTDFGASTPGTFTLTIVGVTDEGLPIVEALWIAEFVVQPQLCTGKLKGVTGSWIMYAWSAPFVLTSDDPVLYGWSGEGRLTFPKKGKK